MAGYIYVCTVCMDEWMDGSVVDTRVDKLIARTHYGQWKDGWMDE